MYSARDFACGAEYSVDIDDDFGALTMWREHGAYHVRHTWWCPVEGVRRDWESFATLAEAKRHFRAIHKQLTAQGRHS